MVNIRNDMYLVSEGPRFWLSKQSRSDADKKRRCKEAARSLTKFIPTVKVAAAIALGLGTMIGWSASWSLSANGGKTHRPMRRAHRPRRRHGHHRRRQMYAAGQTPTCCPRAWRERWWRIVPAAMVDRAQPSMAGATLPVSIAPGGSPLAARHFL
jgi:hypothetical protein